LKAAYGRLLATAKRTGAQGKRVLKVLQERADEPKAQRLAARLEEILPRLKQGIRQAERRVLKDDPVPAGAKLLSLFEPHTQVVPRFKAGKPVEFGRKIRLDEVEGGSSRGTRSWSGAAARTSRIWPTRWRTTRPGSAARRGSWPPTVG